MSLDIDELKLISLISNAKIGDQASMSQLAELVQGRLFAYIYRLTLNRDSAQDILQETLLEMVESLKNLNHVDRFWAWLFRTALGKVQHHYRNQRRKKMIRTSVLEKERLSKNSSQNDGLNHAIHRELSDTIFTAMEKLKLAHRNVLVLRCFEQMSYAEIADLLDCNELRVRVLFFRAKNSLRQQLAGRGFKKTMLLTALGLFGMATTSTTKAASTTGAVTVASMEVGPLAALVGFLGTKIGILLAAVAAGMTVTFVINAFLWFIALLCIALLFVLIGAFTR